MRRVFGLTFTLKWLERHEEEVIEEHKKKKEKERERKGKERGEG